MYPEFIPIYVGLAVVAVLLIVVLILQIVILVKGGSRSGGKPHATNNSRGTVVFCKHCATKYSSSESVCPKCGAPR